MVVRIPWRVLTEYVHGAGCGWPILRSLLELREARDNQMGARQGSNFFPQPPPPVVYTWPPRVPTMTDKSQQPKEKDGVLSALNVVIDGLNLAKEAASVTPAKAVFGSVAVLLAMIRVSFLHFRSKTFQDHTQPGHYGQRSRLCRSRAVLCRYL